MTPSPAPRHIASKVSPTPSSATVSLKGSEERGPHQETMIRKGSLVIVLDDAGYNMDQLKPFLALPFPMTVAVLPGLSHTVEAAHATLRAGKELILHQPMEPHGKENPGPGAIMNTMGAHEAEATLATNLASLPPGAKGVNNHMGSKATENAEIMRALIDYCTEKRLYFLDSRTSPSSAACLIMSENRALAA